MPCEDLLSLTPPGEKVLASADKFLDGSVRSLLSSSKRRRVSNDENENPATAALEAALTFQEEYDTDFLFDSMMKHNLIPATCSEFTFPTMMDSPNPTLSCTKQHKSVSLATVHTVTEMTRALAYLSTASKAA